MCCSNLKKHSSKNPAPMLQAVVLGKPKRIVRNEMENGSTKRHFSHQTHLIEPQGTIKKWNGGRIYGTLVKVERHVVSPQGKIKI